MKSLNEFRQNTPINPEGCMFEFKCKKCQSINVKIRTSFNYSTGSEYTGIYGEEVTILIKCIDCGNAYSIIED
jgi:ribosomal protein S27E